MFQSTIFYLGIYCGSPSGINPEIRSITLRPNALNLTQ